MYYTTLTHTLHYACICTVVASALHAYDLFQPTISAVNASLVNSIIAFLSWLVCSEGLGKEHIPALVSIGSDLEETLVHKGL